MSTRSHKTNALHASLNGFAAVLLNKIVRADNEDPPLKFFGGKVFSVKIVLMFILQHFIVVPNCDLLVGLFYHIFICVYMTILDGFVSNSFGKNIVILRKNGFSDFYIFCVLLSSIIGTQTFGVILNNYTARISPDRFSAENLLTKFTFFAVFVNITLAEITFTIAHKFMHELLPEFHVMHHCCIYSTATTNLIFHPIDLILEFFGPIVCTFITHFLFWDQNTTVLFLSFTIIQFWYMMDHDEGLKLYHFYHHSHVNSVYSIYVKIQSDPKKNLVKNLIKKQ
jgi:sterol desaturase/sphingolipid hydroxylase (fatty acid hydroxylase superfamily)